MDLCTQNDPDKNEFRVWFDWNSAVVDLLMSEALTERMRKYIGVLPDKGTSKEEEKKGTKKAKKDVAEENNKGSKLYEIPSLGVKGLSKEAAGALFHETPDLVERFHRVFRIQRTKEYRDGKVWEPVPIVPISGDEAGAETEDEEGGVPETGEDSTPEDM